MTLQVALTKINGGQVAWTTTGDVDVTACIGEQPGTTMVNWWQNGMIYDTTLYTGPFKLIAEFADMNLLDGWEIRSA